MFDNYCSSLASGVCQRARWPLVHCRWLYKRLLPAVQEAGCGSLAQLLLEYDSVVRRQPAYCSRSSSKLRRLLGGPRLSQHPGAVLHPGPAPEHRLLPPAPLPLHLAAFDCQHGSQVASLLQHLCQGGELWQAVSCLAALQEQYRQLVEVGRGRVGLEALASLVTVVRRCREQSAGAGFGCMELQGGLALSGLQPGLCQEPGSQICAVSSHIV